MTTRTITGSPGLWTAANSETAPMGALKQSLNSYMRSTGLLETVRPVKQYMIGAFTAIGGGSITGIAKYSGRLILRATSALYVETSPGNATFANSSAPFSPNAADGGFYMRSFEANNNLYIPCTTGVLKYDSIATAPYRAGIPRALDPQLTLVGGGTLLASGNSVAYRLVYGLKDANSNLVLGPPSGRVVVTATAAQNVSFKAFLPNQILTAANATSYFVQAYRTPTNTVAGTDPGEEMQVAYQAFITANDVANKFVTFTDALPDTLRGASGYFTPSQDGIAEANYPPPVSNDTALFQTCALYANTTQQQRTQVQLNGVSGNLLTISTAAGGITKSGGNGVYTFTGSPDLTNIPTDGTAKLSSTGNTSAGNNGEFVITAVDNVGKTITVTNAGAVTEPGTALFSRGWPSKLTIAAVNYYGSINGTETVGSQIFKVATAGTASQNVTDTCASLLRVVNQQAVPVVYGYYESGPDDNAGKMSFGAVTLGAASFTLAASGTLLYGSFNPTIPVAAPLTSTNDAASNRLYFSKPNSPEHVPLGNYFDIGSRSKSILRIIPLRQAVLVFKQDGLFRLTGDGAGNFAVSPFDPYSILQDKNGVSVFNNKAYAVLRNGIAEVTESSSVIISDQIADDVRSYIEAGSTNFAVWSIDVDRVIQVFVQNNGASQALFPRSFLYCVATRTWSELPGGDPSDSTVAVTIDGIAYIASAADLYTSELINTTAVRNPAIAASGRPLTGHKLAMVATAQTTGTGGNTITFDNTLSASPAVGDLIMDPSYNIGVVTNLNVVGGSTTMTLALPTVGTYNTFSLPRPNGTPGYVYRLVTQPITVEWVPYTAGADGSTKRFTAASVMLDDNSTTTTCNLSLRTEATVKTLVASMTPTNMALPAGVNTQTLVVSPVLAYMQHARRLSVVFDHATPAEYVLIRGVTYEHDPINGNEVG